MEKYNILHSITNGIFETQLKEIEASVYDYIAKEKSNGRHLAYSKIFLSDIINQYTTLTQSTFYKEVLAKAPCTTIGQAPLCGCKIAILLKTTDKKENYDFHSLRLGEEEVKNFGSYTQTLMLFKKYTDYLEEHNLDMKTHLVRTWIYISDIDVNYAGVVKARNDIFSQYGLTADTHYIASTGIGGDSQTRHACVAIDFLTYPDITESDKTYLKALDHLNPTHEYGVAFERATRLSTTDVTHYYVSGTASIDRDGNILYTNDVEKQTYRLLENIKALLQDGGADMHNIRYFIVYLRDISDYKTVDSVFSSRFPDIPRILVHARVCRPGWLVEAECIAEREPKNTNKEILWT